VRRTGQFRGMLGRMSAFVDHYEVLGVAPTATTLEIRQAYRKRVALEHADRHGGEAAAVERTCSLNLARDVLVDPVRRGQFDVQRGAAAFARDPDPLLDTILRNFGMDPPVGTVPQAPPVPGWLRAAVVGFVGAAAVVTVAAAAFRAARVRANTP
jgi:curved DNA-binding protein CbpA